MKKKLQWSESSNKKFLKIDKKKNIFFTKFKDHKSDEFGKYFLNKLSSSANDDWRGLFLLGSFAYDLFYSIHLHILLPKIGRADRDHLFEFA